MDIAHLSTELRPGDTDVNVSAAFWTPGVPLGSVLGLPLDVAALSKTLITRLVIFPGNSLDNEPEPSSAAWLPETVTDRVRMVRSIWI